MKKGKTTTIILIIFFLIGLCLLLYPKVSNYWNSFHQTKVVNQYIEEVTGIDDSVYEAMMKEAEQYNLSLLDRENKFALTKEQEVLYPNILNVAGNSIMGYIEIPVIGVTLPIYHGTSNSVLQTAIGHIEWTSLPIGGRSTHCALSGHRGLPSSKLFTDLDKLVVGDTFYLRVLNETLTYEVDQILIVEPEDTVPLEITPNCDYCTLVTCTPYGINTHRLLVRGHRTENDTSISNVHITADAIQIEPLLAAPAFFAVILIIALIVYAITQKVRRLNKENNHD
ncbi:MAG: class C sortase [Firmicutes bacterium]|nr:class C sortase [Bacillota bacterium]